MRAKEFLYEDYNQRLDSDLTNLLIGAKGNGATDISTRDLVAQMQKMGYSVDVNSIVTPLQNNPNVSNVTPDSVTLNSGQDGSGGDEQDSASHVQDMAMDAGDLS